MIEENEISGILIAFKRIFAMPISKSTYRQVHNILTLNIKNEEERKEMLHSLLTASFKQGPNEKERGKMITSLLEQFSIPVRVAKEVEERGDLLLFVTSDIVRQGEYPFMINRVRRVDGEEFAFLTDQETTIHLIEHYIKRLNEFDRGDSHFKEKFKERLGSVKTMIEKLTQE